MTDVSCDQLHSANDTCLFVRTTDDCVVDEGFLNYTEFVYCHLGHEVVLACVVLFLWLLFMFTGLATTADDFFCPSLGVISKSLRLSHNVAGVTFLAFGNGAPDIFSAIAAIGNAKAGDAGLAIGALFGAGIFVTAVVAGLIAIICPFNCMERPFLRDVIFYLAAVYWAWHVMWDKQITQWEAIGFILLYVGYVLVVVIGRYINQKLRSDNKSTPLQDEASSLHSPVDLSGDDMSDQPIPPTEPENDTKPLLGKGSGANYSAVDPTAAVANEVEIQEASESDDEDERPLGLWDLFLYDVKPFSLPEFRRTKWYWKVYEIFKSPLIVLLKLTVPVVGEAEEGDVVRNWNRLLNSVHLFTGPTAGVFLTKVGFNKIGGVFPVYGLVMIITFLLAILVFFTTKTHRRPIYHTLFAYLGFVVAITWIYAFANEIVNILQTFGLVFSLSDAILGLTFLAWGNSIGDMIADSTMARHGYPRMAISACFGGPLFNLLIGLGLPFALVTFKNGEAFRLETNVVEMVLAAGLATSLVLSLLIVSMCKFRMSRPYGIGLVVFYVIFLVVAILTEVDVIPNKKL